MRGYGWWRRLLRDVIAMFMALRDPRVPLSAKLVGVASLLYVVFPADLIPDVIPVLGWLDDLAALPIAAYVVRRLTASPVMDGLRDRADATLSWLRPRAVAGILVAVIVVVGIASYAGWRMAQARRAEPVQYLGETADGSR